MKNSLVFGFLTACLVLPAFGSLPGDSLYAKSFLSVNKGDCLIENSKNFAPEIQSFKILIGSQAFKNGTGEAFISYNMLGTSVGIMTPATYKAGQSVGEHMITGQILIGLVNLADVEINTNLINPDGNGSRGTIKISSSGSRVFNSTFVCN